MAPHSPLFPHRGNGGKFAKTARVGKWTQWNEHGGSGKLPQLLVFHRVLTFKVAASVEVTKLKIRLNHV